MCLIEWCQEQEVKLQKALQQVRNQRSVLRQNRQRSQMPTVAVVGYTNAGRVLQETEVNLIENNTFKIFLT